MSDVEWTQGQRIANIERLHAMGVLRRYYVRPPRTFWGLSERRETDKWLRGAFGRRSSRRRTVRARFRVLHKRYEAMRDRRRKKGLVRVNGWTWPLPEKRLHDAMLRKHVQ